MGGALLISDALALLVETLVVGSFNALAGTFAVLVVASRAAFRQYRPRLHLSTLDDVPRSVASALSGMGLSIIALYLRPGFFGAPDGSSATTGSLGMELIWRALWFLLFALVLETVVLAAGRRIRRRPGQGKRTLVVGAGRVGVTVAEGLSNHPELGLLPVGYADSEAMAHDQPLSLPLLCTDLSSLAATIFAYDIDTTVLAFSGTRESEVVDAMITAHQTGCVVMVVPRMFELHHDGPGVERVRGTPLLRLRPDPTLRPSWWVKRSVDIAVALLGLILLSPLLLLLGALVVLDSGRPMLFWQERVGLDGHTFRLCKFRSLRPRNEHDQQTTWNIANDPRLTWVGKFLRRSSLDEIPQLWNILRGQMSLVGPRPERPSFVQQFTDEHERYWARHRVPVGLTGLAQVNGLRGDTSIRDRARFDNYYIANWSLWLDVKILLLTFREVLGGGGR